MEQNGPLISEWGRILIGNIFCWKMKRYINYFKMLKNILDSKTKFTEFLWSMIKAYVSSKSNNGKNLYSRFTFWITRVYFSFTIGKYVKRKTKKHTFTILPIHIWRKFPFMLTNVTTTTLVLQLLQKASYILVSRRFNLKNILQDPNLRNRVINSKFLSMGTQDSI